jgi:hypothetical protein
MSSLVLFSNINVEFGVDQLWPLAELRRFRLTTRHW